MINNTRSSPFSLLLSIVLLLMLWSHASIANQAIDDVEQSPKNKSNTIELPAQAVKKMQIVAGFGWGIFSGTIYNGNREYLITQLTVRMTPIHDQHMEMMGEMSHEPKTHRIDLNLAPLAKGALSMALQGDDAHVHDFDWEILQVLGRKVD